MSVWERQRDEVAVRRKITQQARERMRRTSAAEQLRAARLGPDDAPADDADVPDADDASLRHQMLT